MKSTQGNSSKYQRDTPEYTEHSAQRHHGRVSRPPGPALCPNTLCGTEIMQHQLKALIFTKTMPIPAEWIVEGLV